MIRTSDYSIYTVKPASMRHQQQFCNNHEQPQKNKYGWHEGVIKNSENGK